MRRMRPGADGSSPSPPTAARGPSRRWRRGPPGVRRSLASAARTRSSDRLGRRARRRVDGRAPQGQPRLRRPRGPARSTPSPCGSDAPAARAGSRWDRRRRAAGPRRRRGCRGTSTSCGPATRPSPSARSAGRTATASVRTCASDALISWCGKARSVPPPCTSIVMPRWSSAMAAHSMCQPGRPWPSGVSQAGSSGRADCHTRQSSGCSLPGALRVAAALGEDREHRRLVQSRDPAERGVAVHAEVEVAVDGVDRALAPAACSTCSATDGIDSTAPM